VGFVLSPLCDSPFMTLRHTFPKREKTTLRAERLRPDDISAMPTNPIAISDIRVSRVSLEENLLSPQEIRHLGTMFLQEHS